jgi:cell division septation protein DedD
VHNNVYGTDDDNTTCKFAAGLPLFINTVDLEGLECFDYDAVQCGVETRPPVMAPEVAPSPSRPTRPQPTPRPVEPPSLAPIDPPTTEPTVISSSPEKGDAVLSFIAVVVVGFMMHV